MSLLPTLPDMQRAEPGTFYATAHLESPRDVLERMVFEKTGKDYSPANPKSRAMETCSHVGRRSVATGHLADEKIKPTHVEKKKTGTYYVKKAERLAMEKGMWNWRRENWRERATRSNLPRKDNSSNTIKRTKMKEAMDQAFSRKQV